MDVFVRHQNEYAIIKTLDGLFGMKFVFFAPLQLVMNLFIFLFNDFKSLFYNDMCLL